MKWLLISNKHEAGFDLDGALHADGVNWINNHNVRVGDTVYIYESLPEQYIKYKCVVAETGNRYAAIDESRFGGVRKGSIYDSFVMKLVYEFKIPVPLSELTKHGVSAKRIPVMRDVSKPELFNFLEEYEENDRKDIEVQGFEDIRILPGEERDAVIRVRVNQGRFRTGLLKKYKHCCLCAISNSDLLTASHIKPWADSSPDEKTDIDNGLLLCPNHDRLFDKGYISFDDNGVILLSGSLSDNDRLFLNVSEKLAIELNDNMKPYMKYHRSTVFKN